MKIAVYGGTFDPVHFGHLAVARTVLKEGFADRVVMMVSPLNPLKQGRQLTTDEERLAMLRLALLEYKEIYASDFEFYLPRPSYTINTLRSLRERYPRQEFRLLVGGDNLENLTEWREPDTILREFGLIVYPRPGSDDYIKSAFTSEEQKRIEIMRGVEEYDISSTEIRRRVSEGGSLEGLVPERVADYIKTHSLYL